MKKKAVDSGRSGEGGKGLVIRATIIMVNYMGIGLGASLLEGELWTTLLPSLPILAALTLQLMAWINGNGFMMRQAVSKSVFYLKESKIYLLLNTVSATIIIGTLGYPERLGTLYYYMLSRPSHLEESLERVELNFPLVFHSFLISDITRGNIYPMRNPKTGKILQCVFQITLWAVWKWRNRIVNAPSDSISKIKDEDIFSGIQRLSKTWIADRISPKSANCDVWITRPSDLYV
ncbi:hypothetical protein Tco_1085264 [Tanacetum coccineum]